MTNTKKQSNKAVIYIRVSTEEQAMFGQSLDAQDERLREYCHRAGLDVAELLREEGISGSVPLHKRPQGSRIEKLMKRHQATHIIAVKLDRLFRDAGNCLAQVDNWNRKGIILHLVDFGGQSLDTSSAMGKMMLTMMAGIAEMERNIIAERTTAAMQHMKKHLKAYSPVPFGFDRHGDLFVENDAEQAIRERMLRWRHDDGHTLAEIADILNSHGIPGKAGGKWYPATVRKVLKNSLFN